MVVLDEEMLNSLKDVMADDFSLLLNTFLTDAEQRVEQLKQLNEHSDPDLVRRSAHSLKGSCANVGVVRMAAICQDIEDAGRQQQLHHLADFLTQLDQAFLEAQVALKPFAA